MLAAAGTIVKEALESLKGVLEYLRAVFLMPRGFIEAINN